MRYFIPFYGLWCMLQDARDSWSNDPGNLISALGLVWQSSLLVGLATLVCWITGVMR